MPKSLNLSDREVRDLSVGEKLCLCKRLKTVHTFEMSALSASVNALFWLSVSAEIFLSTL